MHCLMSVDLTGSCMDLPLYLSCVSFLARTEGFKEVTQKESTMGNRDGRSFQGVTRVLRAVGVRQLLVKVCAKGTIATIGHENRSRERF